MTSPYSSRGFGIGISAIFALVPSGLFSQTLTWDNSAGTGVWSTAGNWNPDGVPGSADTVVFPAGAGGEISMATNAQAGQLRFEGDYTLGKSSEVWGMLTLSGGEVMVNDGVTATFKAGLTAPGGLTKSGPGTLVINGMGVQSTPHTLVAGGTLRLPWGRGGTSITVNDGGILDFGNSLSTVLTLMDGAVVRGRENSILSGSVTLNPDAGRVDFMTGAATDHFTLGDQGFHLAGGSAATTVGFGGPGTIRLTGTSGLAVGSSLEGGGGTLEVMFPMFPTDPVVNITPAMNPLGSSGLVYREGTVRLLMMPADSVSAQTFVLPSGISFGGESTLGLAAYSSNPGKKTFEFPGLGLEADTILKLSANNGNSIRLSGPLALQGDATLGVTDESDKPGSVTLNGGISGGATDVLSIAGGRNPLVLVLNAPGTYGGGTRMAGGDVRLNVVDGLGTGPLTLSGGKLRMSVPGALKGPISIQGGQLFIPSADALAGNPVTMTSGMLWLGHAGGATFNLPSLTISGISGLGFGDSDMDPSEDFTVPFLRIAGDTTLTTSSGSSPDTGWFQHLDLEGNLTINTTTFTHFGTITEIGGPRKLIKTGLSYLWLGTPSARSGGTEVWAGGVLAEHHQALGSGALVLGPPTGPAVNTSFTYTGEFTGQPLENDIVVRAGDDSTIVLTATGAPLNGDLELNGRLRVVAGTLNGLISGPGTLMCSSSTKDVLVTNAGNNFGTGAPDNVVLSNAKLSIPNNGALGHPDNGVTFRGEIGTLAATASFSSPRAMTLSAPLSQFSVAAGETLTLTGPITGSGALVKTGPGTLTFSPSANHAGRSNLQARVAGGTLRLVSADNLGTGGEIVLEERSSTLELAIEADTTFQRQVTNNENGTLHVDRAPGGTRTGGRHGISLLRLNDSSFTVTGGHGYGLDIGSVTARSGASIMNEASAPLRIGSVTGESASASTITLGGAGDLRITGSLKAGPASGLSKRGPGTVWLGTSIANVDSMTTVYDGTLDTNGLSFAATTLFIGEGASQSGARLVTGAGSLTLKGDLYSTNFGSPAGASFSGKLALTNAAHLFSIGDSPNAAADLTIDGPISAVAGASLSKIGAGTLRYAGEGNTYPMLTTVSAGTLELAKTSGDGIGIGGLSLTGISSGSPSASARLLANHQIHDSAPVQLNSANEVFLELNNFTDSIGSLSLTQTDGADYTAVKTGADGRLAVTGDISLNNNATSAATNARNVLITGTGGETTPATDGTLDLGGATRTIAVNGTSSGTYAGNAGSTIETRITNGGIRKTGAKTLHLRHPDNSFAGGLEIAGGMVRPYGSGSLGKGPVTISGGAGTGIDFTGSSLVSNALTIGGNGNTTITHAAPAPQVLTLAGDITLKRSLTVDVVNGSKDPAASAQVDITGRILDGGQAGEPAHGLVKNGYGLLKLGSNNTYDGETQVMKGSLQVSDNSSLGLGNAALVLDGGALHLVNELALERPVRLGGHGTLTGTPQGRVAIPELAWASATSSFYGSSMAIIASTTHSAGDVWLGWPMGFAPDAGTPVPTGFTLSLRGSAQLPAGNLAMTHLAVLELGNGDFSRPLGAGPGEVSLATGVGAGWAAHGAERRVNLGGAGQKLVWGQESPAFLYNHAPGSAGLGALVLGSATATHTIDFQNPLELHNAANSEQFKLLVQNGSAALDAKLSGDITYDTGLPGAGAVLELACAGNFEASGDIALEIAILKTGPGTAFLTGDETLGGSYRVEGGELKLGSDTAPGEGTSITVWPGSHLDASAAGVPLRLTAAGESRGIITGDLLVDGASFWLGGQVTGSVGSTAEAVIRTSRFEQPLITGDFHLHSGAEYRMEIDGPQPGVDHSRTSIGGTVQLEGALDVGYPQGLAEGDTLMILLNGGIDPVQGTFKDLPEGATIPIDGGLALKVSYLANGDGGAVGNDISLSVVEGPYLADRQLMVEGPVAVLPGQNFNLDCLLRNDGPSTLTDGKLVVTLPADVALVSYPPGGTREGNTLEIPAGSLAPDGTATLSLALTAPVEPGQITIHAGFHGGLADPVPSNNSVSHSTRVMAADLPEIHSFTRGEGAGGPASLTLYALPGVRYVLEASDDLSNWRTAREFTGDGSLHTEEILLDQDAEFFRFRTVPVD